MTRSLLLAGLLAAFLSPSAYARANGTGPSPSPTVVYYDLITIGGGTGCGDVVQPHSETGNAR